MLPLIITHKFRVQESFRTRKKKHIMIFTERTVGHVVLFVRNYHLNWDGFSHVSALEQNFNPSKDDIERRRRQGNRRATAVAAAARRNRVFYIMIFLLYCLSQSF